MLWYCECRIYACRNARNNREKNWTMIFSDILLNYWINFINFEKRPSRRCAPWARRCIIGGKKWPECSVLRGITASQKDFTEKWSWSNAVRMAFAILKITACVCAYCAAEMAGELIRNLSEKLPVEGACPCLWCRPEKFYLQYQINVYNAEQLPSGHASPWAAPYQPRPCAE